MSWAEQFGVSIFTTITQKAQQFSAINLAQGFPDFDGPDEIKEAAIKAIREGMNQYAPSAGVLKLRENLAKHYEGRLAVPLDPLKNITVVSGATEALYLAIKSLHRPEEEMITFAPFFDCYEASAKLSGVVLKTVELSGAEWSFDLKSLEAQLTAKTKSILINTPHNPTGKVFTEKEIRLLADFAIKHDLLVITDEVYEELIFDNHKHISPGSLPELKDRVVVISSGAKNYSMTGWKIGYIFASDELTKEIRAVHQFTVFCSATPLQYGIAKALELPQSYYDSYIEEYNKRREVLCQVLLESGFKPFKPMGSYFVIADYSAIRDVPDMDFLDWMIEEKGVAAIPLSPFYTDKERALRENRFLRFAFCKSLDTIHEAANRLKF